MSVGTPDQTTQVLRLVAEPTDVEVAAGDTARLARHGRHRRAGRPGAGGAPDQPVGNLGVDRPRRASGAVLPAARTVELGFDVAPPAVGASPASGGR